MRMALVRVHLAYIGQAGLSVGALGLEPVAGGWAWPGAAWES